MPAPGSHAHIIPLAPHPGDDDDRGVDAGISCDSCDAVCCRLTVVVMPEDRVPRHMVEHGELGLEVMARGEDGWCVAVDHTRMCCGIYEQRPAICRKFAMGSAYCRDEREQYRHRFDREIPLLLR
ncbi:YkgJ family cysteine cluster protein [Lysobacter sp. F6437]|uniref:YkgJ family cysteine cluster protein n=1 Tax=Lysobacter sp. F6437 TaxID=3459296 RepID=UPI00403D83CE